MKIAGSQPITKRSVGSHVDEALSMHVCASNTCQRTSYGLDADIAEI